MERNLRNLQHELEQARNLKKNEEQQKLRFLDLYDEQKKEFQELEKEKERTTQDLEKQLQLQRQEEEAKIKMRVLEERLQEHDKMAQLRMEKYEADVQHEKQMSAKIESFLQVSLHCTLLAFLFIARCTHLMMPGVLVVTCRKGEREWSSSGQK